MTYAMGLVAQNTDVDTLFAVTFSQGQVTVPSATMVTLKEAVTDGYVAVQLGFDAQLSAPPCDFDFSFGVTPFNDTISGQISVGTPVSVPVKLTLYGNTGPIGSAVTLPAGQKQVSFFWNVQSETALEDDGTSFFAARRPQRPQFRSDARGAE